MRPPMLKGLKMEQIEGKKGTNSAKMLLVSSWLGPALLVSRARYLFFFLPATWVIVWHSSLIILARRDT